jgi:signal peptidase I
MNQPPAANEPQPSLLRIVLIGRRPRNTFVRIVVLVVGCVIVFGFILLPIRIEGVSMLPTYHDSQVNFVNRLAYVRHEPRRGDVVSIKLAGHSIMYMKRIVGLPGETIAFSSGKLLVNGEFFDEPYVKNPCDWEIAPVKLGTNEFYVVGDNREMPEKNHEKGIAPRWRIVGKVLL